MKVLRKNGTIHLLKSISIRINQKKLEPMKDHSSLCIRKEANKTNKGCLKRQPLLCLKALVNDYKHDFHHDARDGDNLRRSHEHYPEENFPLPYEHRHCIL